MDYDWGLDIDPAGTGEQWQDGDLSLPGAGRKRFHFLLFASALLGGALGAFAGRGIYSRMYDPSGSNVLMTGLILAVISAFVLLACSLCELFCPRVTVNRELNLPRILSGLLAAAAVFAVGCLCEFLYEWNSAYAAVEFNDYIFAIDDSGSMSGTDPQNLRYSALAGVFGAMDEDERAGLVRFNEDAYVPVDLGAMDEAQRTRLIEGVAVPRSDGSTDLYKALAVSLDLHQRGAQPGRAPVVVLLSDGRNEVPSAVPFRKFVRRFLDAGVAVSTVSLGPNTDEKLLQSLAQATGGQYFKVEQAGDLAQALRQTSTPAVRRCLFSPRPGIQRGSVLCMALRVLFLTLPGLVIGFFILLLLQSSAAGQQLLVSGAAGLLAGLVMEAGTYFLLPLALTQTVSWLLYGLVLLQYSESAGGVRQSELETADPAMDWDGEWDALPEDPFPGMSEVSRSGGGSRGRIDHGDDWGQF